MGLGETTSPTRAREVASPELRIHPIKASQSPTPLCSRRLAERLPPFRVEGSSERRGVGETAHWIASQCASTVAPAFRRRACPRTGSSIEPSTNRHRGTLRAGYRNRKPGSLHEFGEANHLGLTPILALLRYLALRNDPSWWTRSKFLALRGPFWSEGRVRSQQELGSASEGFRSGSNIPRRFSPRIFAAPFCPVLGVRSSPNRVVPHAWIGRRAARPDALSGGRPAYWEVPCTGCAIS